MTPPTFPVKLEYLFFHFVDLDAAGQGGDGSFYLYLVDYYGYLIEPLDLGLLTPSDTGWNYLDVSSYDIIVNSDFFAGIIYDGFNTPALGLDTSYSGRSFYWVASDTAWNDLGYSLFIRAIVSHLVPTDVEQDLPSGLPSAYVLHQNYPNPFNPSTVIEYSIPRRSQVEITLYNLLGQKVKTLVDKAEPAGNYSAYWNGTDYSGKPVASGVYLYRLKAGDFVETRKMILLK